MNNLRIANMRCIFIHGIGEFSQSYVWKKAIKLKPENIKEFDVLYWADIMDEYEKLLMHRYKKEGLLDRVLIMWFADAIAYANKRDEIFKRFLEIDRKGDLVLISHSLGTIIALDIIHTFKLENITLFTLASPLPLYAAKFSSRKQLMSLFPFDITNPKKWINIYYKEDIFAFPLKDYGATDYELSAKCLLCKMPIVNRFKSHGEYFKDKRVKEIINKEVSNV